MTAWPLARRVKRQDVLALLCLALLALIFFWPVTLNLGWIPRGGGDLASFLWPTYNYASQSLRAGRLPLWNPTLYSGAPFAADNQTSLFYPINLVVFLLAPSLPYTLMEWLVVFHFWVAGASMYFCMRVLLADESLDAAGALQTENRPVTLSRSAAKGLLARLGMLSDFGRRCPETPAPSGGRSVLSLSKHASFDKLRTLVDGGPSEKHDTSGVPEETKAQPAEGAPSAVWPALFAAVAFMFSDVLVIHVGNLNTVAASVWLPAVFAALHLALTRRSLGWAAAGGALLGLDILAGQIHMTYIGLVGLGLYALWQVAWAQGRRLQMIAVGAAFLAVAFGLTAFVLVPSVELTAFTARTRLTFAEATTFAIPGPGLAGLFSPLVFGRGPAYFWGTWDRVELGYLGVLPLLLAGLGAFRRRAAVFFAGLALFALAAALGSLTPLYRALYEVLPGFSGLRGPARFMLLGDFSLAALGGFGLYHLARVPRWRALAWGTVVGAAGLAAMILGHRQVVAQIGVPHASDLQQGLAVFLVLLAAGLALVLWGARWRWAPMLALGILAADLVGLGAWVEVDQSDPTAGFQHPKVAEFLKAQLGPTRIDNAAGAWAPDAAASLGLEDIGGLSNPLSLAAYQTYLGAVGSRGSPLYNFLNVQFVVADKGQPPGDATFVPVFDEDPALDVYLNTQARPRVSLIYTATVAPDGEAAFGALFAPGFDPAQQVVIERGPPVSGGAPSGDSNLNYTDYAPEHFSVEALTPAPAYLVFSEVWYPGWRAWVDGVETPVYRANFAFRAVYLAEPGRHTVTVRYDPSSWKIGLAITLVTLAALAGWRLWARRRLIRPHF